MAAKVVATIAFLWVIASITSVSVQASTISVSYSFAGTLSNPVITGTTATLSGVATGTLLTSDPSLNAALNPMTVDTFDDIDGTNGLNNGSFSLTFANGETLFGNLFENDAAVLPTDSGPFTQVLTFTGGTGEFAGATGSASGGGIVTFPNYVSSGSGFLTATGITPEPASIALVCEGLIVLAASRKLFRRRI